MNADGSGLTRLTANEVDDQHPVWSPDGSRIAFERGRVVDFPEEEGGPVLTYEIYLMNADGTGQTNLTDNSESEVDAAWSPDGSRIAFTSFRDGNAEIYVMNADGTGQTNLTNNPAAQSGHRTAAGSRSSASAISTS